MKRRILIHRGKYAVEENEVSYRSMSAKGWTLEKRGKFLSYFRREDPSERFYRMILVKPQTWRDPEIEVPDHSEEGWELISKSGGAWIYATDRESTARSALGPAQSETALKALRKKYAWNYIGVLFVFLPFRTLQRLFGSDPTPVKLFADYLRILIQYSAIGILLSGLFLLFFLHLLYATYRLSRELGKIRHGFDRGLYDKQVWAPSWIRILAIGFFLAFASLSLGQAISKIHYEMPVYKEEGYMILEDLGHAPRKEFDVESDPIRSPDFGVLWEQNPLLSKWIMTTEYGDGAFMHQIRVQLIHGLDPMKFAEIMIVTEEIGDPLSGYRSFEIPGVDAAYAGDSGLGYVLVKGQNVLFFRYFVNNFTLDNESEQRQVLEKAAKVGF